MTERSPATTALVPQDRGLPQLARALSSEWMAGVLREAGVVVDATSCTPVYLRYKPETNCVTLYEVEKADGSKALVYSKIYAEPRPPRPSDRILLSHYLPDVRMAISAFPRDQQIPSLQKLWDSGPESHLFKRLISTRRRPRFEQTWGKWELIRYKPERRCLVRGEYLDPDWTGGHRGFFARVYGDSQGARTARWHRHFARAGNRRLKIPTCLTDLPKSRVLLIKQISGLGLTSQLEDGGPALDEFISKAAEGLAELHLLPAPEDVQPLRDRSQLSSALKGIEELGEIDRFAISSFGEELGHSLPAATGQRLLHGDYYHDQVLVDADRRPGIIDLDQLALGDPAADVANFCAHLSQLALDGRLTWSRAAHIESLFVERYQAASGQSLPERNFRWHLAVALLKLAPWPFRRFQPDWPERTRQLFDLAVARWGGRQC